MAYATKHMQAEWDRMVAQWRHMHARAVRDGKVVVRQTTVFGKHDWGVISPDGEGTTVSTFLEAIKFADSLVSAAYRGEV